MCVCVRVCVRVCVCVCVFTNEQRARPRRSMEIRRTGDDDDDDDDDDKLLIYINPKGQLIL